MLQDTSSTTPRPDCQIVKPDEDDNPGVGSNTDNHIDWLMEDLPQELLARARFPPGC